LEYFGICLEQSMPYHTPAEIREQLIDPLMAAISKLSTCVGKLESLVKDGTLPSDGMPLQPATAIRGMKHIKAFARQLDNKIESALDGTLLARERERLRKEAVRSKTKKRT